MEKHKFLLGVSDERGVVVGAQCVRCAQISLYDKTGKVPDETRQEDCPVEREDVNQAAARIIREATESD
jgi:hypothetical protein